MKKLIVTLSILLAGMFSVHAQEQSPTDKVAALLTNVCGLSTDQAAKVRPMLDAFVTTRTANKQKYASDAQGLEKADQSNKDNLKAQLKTVLTAEQVQKWEDYQQQKKEREESLHKQ